MVSRSAAGMRSAPRERGTSIHRLVTMGVAAVAPLAGMLLAGAPVRSLSLPLLVLACPLMMIFMMRGHG
jgi:hypothetical protein